MTNNISYNNVWGKSGNIREIVLTFNINKSISSVALEMLDLNKRGFIHIPRSATQKTIEANISSAIGKVKPTPTVTPGTGEFLKCGKCGKTGKEKGVCVFGACLTFIPIKGGGKGSITWTF